MEPRELVDAFYSAFARRDGAAMAASYDPAGRFDDPVFPGLSGEDAGWMWRMLCERGEDLKIEHRIERVEGSRVFARWEAWYTFSVTGRKVHNVIDAEIEVKDGKIVSHRDQFDFWRWSRQALGPAGWLLGWTPLVQGKVSKQAGEQLARYKAKNTGK